ncbi:MAG TPA: HD domain-containing protein [Candidatus Latescibacteria bacterium]|nr:HD domain-containing protein [Candidatus Latescibacterota bacterium]
MRTDRLSSQLRFIVEVDELKHVLRQTLLPRDRRRENDAEHSWHLALMAVVLAEHAEGGVDPLRVVKMALIHDLVEIDAGDTFAYDEEAHADKEKRERAGAERIFALLPAAQGGEMRELWEEFEARDTADSRFAAALDRLQPLLLNYASGGDTWRRHGVRRDQVVARNRHMEEGAPSLWRFAADLIERAVAEGKLEA